MKIYTKTGDDGTTGVYGGGRLRKDSLRISAIGDVDELNAAIGLVRQCSSAAELLGDVQNWLFDLGSELAMPSKEQDPNWISIQAISAFEEDMDRMSAELPPLRNFILPGGTELAARLHFARTVCRRAERAVWALDEEDSLRSEPKVFLNRLSDWLFISARHANFVAGHDDVPWSSNRG